MTPRASQPEMRGLPTGTVTFLFTDVAGSTRLLREHGAGYAELLGDHRRALRAASSKRAVSRSTRRAMRSSSRSRAHRTRLQRHKRDLKRGIRLASAVEALWESLGTFSVPFLNALLERYIGRARISEPTRTRTGTRGGGSRSRMLSSLRLPPRHLSLTRPARLFGENQDEYRGPRLPYPFDRG